MARYDVRCPEHGVHEVFRSMSLLDFCCEVDPDCQRPVEQVISAPYMSVSAEGEDARDPQRVKDGTAGFNLGLPGVDTVVGKRSNGKAALSYRPVTNNELPTRRAREDHARRHGLVPYGGAPKRAIGGR